MLVMGYAPLEDIVNLADIILEEKYEFKMST